MNENRFPCFYNMNDNMNMNPLRWPSMPVDHSYLARLEWELAHQRIPAMSPRLSDVEARPEGLTLGMNPMEQYARPQGRPSFPHQEVLARSSRLAAVEACKSGLIPGPQDAGPQGRPSLPVPAYPQARPSLPPPGGPYIRPAVIEDAEEIVQIINWYSTISPVDTEPEVLEPEHVHNFLETCKARRLPCLVLICPPEMTQSMLGRPLFKIFGVAYIDAFDEVVTEDSIGDMRVYVRQGWTRYGFGTMLVDCILSICDEYYRRRFVYEWRPLGHVELHVLRLRRLMCAIAYPAQLEGNYAWTWHWLKNRFSFMDFGELRQDRAKYGYEYVIILSLSV